VGWVGGDWKCFVTLNKLGVTLVAFVKSRQNEWFLIAAILPAYIKLKRFNLNVVVFPVRVPCSGEGFLMGRCLWCCVEEDGVYATVAPTDVLSLVLLNLYYRSACSVVCCNERMGTQGNIYTLWTLTYLFPTALHFLYMYYYYYYCTGSTGFVETRPPTEAPRRLQSS